MAEEVIPDLWQPSPLGPAAPDLVAGFSTARRPISLAMLFLEDIAGG